MAVFFLGGVSGNTKGESVNPSSDRVVVQVPFGPNLSRPIKQAGSPALEIH